MIGILPLCRVSKSSVHLSLRYTFLGLFPFHFLDLKGHFMGDIILSGHVKEGITSTGGLGRSQRC